MACGLSPYRPWSAMFAHAPGMWATPRKHRHTTRVLAPITRWRASPKGCLGEVGDGADVASSRGSSHVSVLLRTAHDTHGAQVGFGHSTMLVEHNGGRGVGMKSVHQAGAIPQQHEDFLAFGHPGMGGASVHGLSPL